MRIATIASSRNAPACVERLEEEGFKVAAENIRGYAGQPCGSLGGNRTGSSMQSFIPDVFPPRALTITDMFFGVAVIAVVTLTRVNVAEASGLGITRPIPLNVTLVAAPGTGVTAALTEPTANSCDDTTLGVSSSTTCQPVAASTN